MKFDISQDEIVKVLKMTDPFNRVGAMKKLMDKTNCDLKEAKDYCDIIIGKIQKGEL